MITRTDACSLHNIRRIDRLIRADQYKSLADRSSSPHSRLIRSDRIVLMDSHGLSPSAVHVYEQLHGTPPLADTSQIPALILLESLNGTNQDHQIQIRYFFSIPVEYHMHCFHKISKHDQLFLVDTMRSDDRVRIQCFRLLRSPSPFAMNKRMDLFHILFDRLPSQQLLHVDIPQSTHPDLSSQELIHARQVFQLTSRLLYRYSEYLSFPLP